MSGPSLIRCASCGATNRVQSHGEQLPVCGRCKTLLSTATGPVAVTDATFASAVERASLPVLVDLWAAWCGPCRMIAPSIDQLAKELNGRVLVAKLNIDENPDTARRFNVQSIPTLLIFKDGREVDRIIGAQPKSEIARRLQAWM